MQHWDLLAIDAPKGKRDPVVVHEDAGARALLVVLQPGEELGEHQVRENAWVTVVSGEVTVRAEDEQIAVGPGSLLRFEPAERHSLATTTGARLLIVLAPWPGEGHFPGP
jgi:quercetin dioxygenase-like cupin family protein